MGKRKEQVPSKMERIYNRIQYLRRKRKPRECKRGNQGVWEEILMRPKGNKLTKKKRRNLQKEKITRRFIAKKLFGWSDKRYDEEYWGRLERNWRCWKREWAKERRILKIIRKKEKATKQENLEIRE